MAARTVKLGFVVYTDAEGRPATGYIGDEVNVHKDDLDRFDRLNVLPDVAEAQKAEAALSPADIETASAEVEAEAQKVAEAKTTLDAERAAFEAEKAAFEAQKAEAARATPATSSKPTAKS